MSYRFRNEEPPHDPHAFATVFRWAVLDRALRRRRRSPSRADVPCVAPDLDALGRTLNSVTWVGHASWVVRLAGTTILTDPVWSARLGPGLVRNVPPGVPIDAFEAQIVVVSHNHRDHLDAPTIGRLGSRPRYVVPAGLGGFFRARGANHVTELEWWEQTECEGVSITLVPSQHWSQRGPFDRNETLWGGYVMQGGDRSVYFAGDTAYFGGFTRIGERFPNIDAALLPIGAYDPEWFMRSQHMNPEDAVNAFIDLKARLLCPMHWGTFKLTDEPLTEPPERLEIACAARSVMPDSVWLAPIGGSRTL